MPHSVCTTFGNDPHALLEAAGLEAPPLNAEKPSSPVAHPNIIPAPVQGVAIGRLLIRRPGRAAPAIAVVRHPLQCSGDGGCCKAGDGHLAQCSSKLQRCWLGNQRLCRYAPV